MSGTPTPTASPEISPTAATVAGVTAISAGWHHTCALFDNGGVKCWGWNVSGQLGDGTTHDSSVPVAVSGLASGVTAITAGANHTCALTDTGAVECWGDNLRGQVGVATNADTLTPVLCPGLAAPCMRSKPAPTTAAR